MVTPNDEALIRTLLSEWKDALLAQDIDRLLALYSDDFVNAEGQTKQALADSMRVLKKSAQLDGATIDTDVATVTLKRDSKATAAQVRSTGTDQDLSHRFTLTRVDGSWLISASETDAHSAPLLKFLRKTLDAPSLAYEKTPTQIAEGGEAIILSLSLSDPQGETEWGSVPLVCKMMRNPLEGEEVIKKVAACQKALCALSYPAPRVVAVGAQGDGLNTSFLVMERMQGRSGFEYLGWSVLIWFLLAVLGALLPIPMLSSPVPALIGLTGIFVTLAFCTRALLHLHGLPADAFLRELAKEGLSANEIEFGAPSLDALEQRIVDAGANELVPGLEWLRTRMPDIEGRKVISHLDHHPGNVILNRRGISGVIDWNSPIIAEPEFDFGWTRTVDVMIWFMFPPVPAPYKGLRTLVCVTVSILLTVMLQIQELLYRPFAKLQSDKVRYYAAYFCLGHMLIPDAGSDEGHRSLRRRFRRATGLTIAPDERRLAWVDRNGQEKALSMPSGLYSNPRISPDGERLAVCHSGDIWVQGLTDDKLNRFTSEPSVDLSPTWSPDGRSIAFSAALSPAEGNLLMKSADGTGEAVQLTERPGMQVPCSWSPDGKRLVFFETASMSMGVLAIDEEHSVNPFPNGSAIDADGEVSPDGNWLAFAVNESGDGSDQFEIIVQAFPDPGERVQISIGGGRWPRWAPNGKELYYQNGTKMMAVAVQTKPDFCANSPQILFEGSYYGPMMDGRNYDVTADGGFLMILRGREANTG